MRMSRNSTCGSRRKASRTALRPSPTMASTSQFGPGGLRVRRAGPAPAAARLRQSGRWLSWMKRKVEDGAGAAARQCVELQSATRTVDGGQALAHLRQAEARRSGRWARCESSMPTPVSRTSMTSCPSPSPPRPHDDLAAFHLGLQPVADAVLHQRLQHQRRHRQLAQILRAAPACSAGACPCAPPSAPGSRPAARTRPRADAPARASRQR